MVRPVTITRRRRRSRHRLDTICSSQEWIWFCWLDHVATWEDQFQLGLQESSRICRVIHDYVLSSLRQERDRNSQACSSLHLRAADAFVFFSSRIISANLVKYSRSRPEFNSLYLINYQLSSTLFRHKHQASLSASCVRWCVVHFAVSLNTHIFREHHDLRSGMQKGGRKKESYCPPAAFLPHRFRPWI